MKDTTAVEITAVDTTTEESTAEDSTAELSKKGGQFGGTYDSHIIMEPGAVPNNKPSITLCTVQTLIWILMFSHTVVWYKTAPKPQKIP